jgi:hypothetical protein
VWEVPGLQAGAFPSFLLLSPHNDLVYGLFGMEDRHSESQQIDTSTDNGLVAYFASNGSVASTIAGPAGGPCQSTGWALDAAGRYVIVSGGFMCNGATVNVWAFDLQLQALAWVQVRARPLSHVHY